MENTQPILTAPVSLIILPASTSGGLSTLQPLTVITTNTLNSSLQPVTITTNNLTNTTTMPLTTAIPLTTSNILTTSASNIITTSATKSHTTGTPPLKPAKKFRQEQEEILRCKRRLEFVGSMGVQSPQPGTVLRRNERERNRVKLINNTFVRLRDHLPMNSVKTSKGKAKKLSKVDTLQRAIDYIRNLQQLIDEHDAVESAFDGGIMAPPLQQASPQSPSLTSLHSPGSTGDSENLSDEASVSPDEEDLLDFTSWF